MERNLEKLEDILNVSFNNKDILKNALVHRSYLNEHKSFALEHNERLEFLGDSIVGLATVSYLYTRFFDQNEGVMTRLKACLVNTNALANFAEFLGLYKFIILSKQIEEKNGGKKNRKIMEDVFEAFIGAIYEDVNQREPPYESLKFSANSNIGYQICEKMLINIFHLKLRYKL